MSRGKGVKVKGEREVMDRFVKRRQHGFVSEALQELQTDTEHPETRKV